MDDLTERLEVGGDVEVGKTKGVVKNVLKCVEGSDKGVLLFLLGRGGREREKERKREGEREREREREKEREGGDREKERI